MAIGLSAHLPARHVSVAFCVMFTFAFQQVFKKGGAWRLGVQVGTRLSI